MTTVTSIMKDIPPKVIAETLDSILIDYSIACVQQQQSVPTQQAVENIQIARKVRDAFFEAANEQQS